MEGVKQDPRRMTINQSKQKSGIMYIRNDGEVQATWAEKRLAEADPDSVRWMRTLNMVRVTEERIESSEEAETWCSMTHQRNVRH